jgi:hypothetical protein
VLISPKCVISQSGTTSFLLFFISGNNISWSFQASTCWEICLSTTTRGRLAWCGVKIKEIVKRRGDPGIALLKYKKNSLRLRTADVQD